MDGSVAHLQAERARLVQQAQIIEHAQQAGAARVTFDGSPYTVDHAMELTRAAIFAVESALTEAKAAG